MRITFLSIALACALSIHAQVLVPFDSLQFTNAQIWGVISDQGDSLCITTTFNPGIRPHIYLRKADYLNIHSQTNPVQLTFDSDFTSINDLTDHKHIVLNNEIYVAFSTQGDQELMLFKTDINGNRIGNMVAVTLGPGDPTNDMILTTDSTYIFVLHFDPPGQHHVYKYDTNLNLISSFSTTTNPHNNIGGAIMVGGNFNMFTGSTFGFNSNLTLTKWDASWSPISTQNILSSTSGDGNWFATGIAHDDYTACWMIGLSHIEPPSTINQEHIDIALFDNNFNVIDRLHVTGDAYFRPHFVFKNGYLYMSYDGAGGVYLKQYYLMTGAIIEDAQSNVRTFPVPASDKLYVENVIKHCEAEIFDIAGKCVIKQGISPGQSSIDISLLAEGIYTIRLSSEYECRTGKIIIEH